MYQPEWQSRLEPFVGSFVGLIMVACGTLIVDTGLETKGAHLWEPLDLLFALKTGSVRISGWGELVLGTAFQVYGIVMIWISIRRLARGRTQSGE